MKHFFTFPQLLNRMCLKKIASTIFVLFLTLNSFSQIIVIDSYFYLADEIGEDTLDAIVDSVEDAMRDYVKYAGLAGEGEGVSQVNLNRFKNLFASNARILDDFSETPGQMNFSDYAGEVFEYLNEEGLKFDMYGALIDVISYDSTGYYQIDVVTQKFVYNGLQTDKRPFYCKKGRRYKMLMSYRIPVDDLLSAKIHKINGTLEEDCDGNSPRITGAVMLNSVQQKFETSSFWNNELRNMNFTPAASYEIGVGARVHYPITKNKSLYAALGAFYTLSSQKVNLSGFYEAQKTTSEGIPYIQENIISNGVEEIKLGSVQVPLGIRWHTFGKEPFYLFTDIYGIAKIPLHVNSTTSLDKVSTQFYEDGTVIRPNDTNAGVVPDMLFLETTPETRINFAVMAAFSFQYAVSSNWAVETAINYTRGLTNILDEGAYRENYPISDEDYLENNFLSNYTQDYKNHTFGLQIGIIYKP
ncbi:MAG: opacity protein-like surface antigen [Saprospiraceae bacterium]|jgi:opacity protein-like surface antigen